MPKLQLVLHMRYSACAQIMCEVWLSLAAVTVVSKMLSIKLKGQIFIVLKESEEWRQEK